MQKSPFVAPGLKISHGRARTRHEPTVAAHPKCKCYRLGMWLPDKAIRLTKTRKAARRPDPACGSLSKNILSPWSLRPNHGSFPVSLGRLDCPLRTAARLRRQKGNLDAVASEKSRAILVAAPAHPAHFLVRNLLRLWLIVICRMQLHRPSRFFGVQMRRF